MAGVGAIYKLKYASRARLLAEEAGRSWEEMDEKEKEMYYSKAHQQEQENKTTRPMGMKPSKRY